MAFVLDASVTGSWLFGDESRPEADATLDLLLDEGAVVPVLWWFEVRNIVLAGERRSRISTSGGLEFLRLLARLPIALAPLPRDEDVLELARRHRLTFYDAAYCELALREGLQLATLDHELIDAARREGISTIG